MATFAVLSGNRITNVIVADDQVTAEEVAGAPVIEYSRDNPAGIDYTYDEDRDAFIPPKPDGNFVLDEQTCLWREVE